MSEKIYGISNDDGIQRYKNLTWKRVLLAMTFASCTLLIWKYFSSESMNWGQYGFTLALLTPLVVTITFVLIRRQTKSLQGLEYKLSDTKLTSMSNAISNKEINLKKVRKFDVNSSGIFIADDQSKLTVSVYVDDYADLAEQLASKISKV